MSKLVDYIANVALQYEGNDCLTWPFGANSMGYAMANGQLVSRIVCELAHGKPPSPKHEAAHLCGKGHLACIAKKHLAWKTHQENHADRIRHGTSMPGNVKLTEEEVRQIRSLNGVTQQRIADLFGISRGHVGLLRQAKRWPI